MMSDPKLAAIDSFRRGRQIRLCCQQVEYPEIEEGTRPRHRFMSAFEQRKEACDRKYQFLLFAAEPYEVIAFKVPNMEIEKTEVFFSHW